MTLASPDATSESEAIHSSTAISSSTSRSGTGRPTASRKSSHSDTSAVKASTGQVVRQGRSTQLSQGSGLSSCRLVDRRAARRIAEFEQSFATRLDDLAKQGVLDPAKVIYERFRDRALLQIETNLAELRDAEHEFDFNSDASLPVERDAYQWPEDLQAAELRREQNLILAMLNLKRLVNLPAGAAVVLTTSLTTDAQFASWGWRLPFLASAILVGLGLWVRLKIGETPAFKKAVAEAEPSHVPIAEAVRRHPGALLGGTFAVVACFAIFYISTAFALGYGTTTLGYSRETFLGVQLGAILFLAAGIVTAGWWSDASNPRRVLMAEPGRAFAPRAGVREVAR